VVHKALSEGPLIVQRRIAWKEEPGHADAIATPAIFREWTGRMPPSEHAGAGGPYPPLWLANPNRRDVAHSGNIVLSLRGGADVQRLAAISRRMRAPVPPRDSVAQELGGIR
jgi:hypothetical protein